ncbi:Protein of unknown function [Bacillus mycoides]|nr:Protein of unknown function [Bacillus mycoides]
MQLNGHQSLGCQPKVTEVLL